MKLSPLGLLLVSMVALVLFSPTAVMGQSFELNPYIGFYSASPSSAGQLGTRASMAFGWEPLWIQIWKSKHNSDTSSILGTRDVDARNRGVNMEWGPEL